MDSAAVPAFTLMVDCNNFYVSCERVFDATLARRPVVVLSNNDGCVIARSNEAKALEIEIGDPVFKRKDFFARHGVRILSSNYALYGDMSARVMQVLARFSPDVERYSIDEAFLLFPARPPDELRTLAEDIRRTVLRWTGIPACVGVARTKTLAKIANRLAKKTPASGGVWLLDDPADIAARLAQVAVDDVWGIGRRYAAFLRGRGIATALQLARQPRDWVRRHLTIGGLHTVMELGGEPCIPFEENPPPARSLLCSRSFGERVADLGSLEEALSTHVQRAAEKLRQKGLRAGAVQAFLETSRFRPEEYFAHSGCQALAAPTAYTPELHAAALRILRAIYRPGHAYQRIGVLLLDLVPEGARQLTFWDLDVEQPRHKALMQALDKVNATYGRGTLVFAAAGLGPKAWHMRQERRSNRYTTRWAELPVAH
ncbi:MAG: Y-family DNA polymerase [Opitutae bacterium]|nr:Y-family DNA polymerase [Opitutae bacterium]